MDQTITIQIYASVSFSTSCRLLPHVLRRDTLLTSNSNLGRMKYFVKIVSYRMSWQNKYILDRCVLKNP